MAGDDLDATEFYKSMGVPVAVEERQCPVDLLAVGQGVVGGSHGFSIRARGIRGRCADLADLGRLVIVFQPNQGFLGQPLEPVPRSVDVTLDVAGAGAL
ncbi:hypothetical protein A8M77_16820 [Variovorax sp. JS1663]|nr:hypothetical protein A8M77_16820 [Variovorax sp. JS1663]